MRPLARFCLALVVLMAACSRPPALDWQGRCGTDRDRSAQVAGIDVGDWSRRSKAGAAGKPGTLNAVLDRAGLFDENSAKLLARELAAFHRETCHQFAVVTTSTLDGHPIDDYSLALANHLGLGYEQFNNGLLLLIAPNERSARIEVGCGLEDLIRDGDAKVILTEKVIPACRQKDYARAASDGIHALMALARRKQVPEGSRPAASAAGNR